MKKIIYLSILLVLLSLSGTSFASYDSSLNKDPIFMEQVYSFILTEDSTTTIELSYCEQVYLEATRRREYTESETSLCGDYFIVKNNEEKAYMQYMFNNRELFY